MKKFLIFGFIAFFALTGCKKDQAQDDAANQALANQEALNQATREELQAALAERDELLDIINGINTDISEIQSVEHIVSVNGVSEKSQKTTISENLSSLKSTLADRRKRLSELEAKLKDSKLDNSKLLETIEGLRKQIDEQTAQIETLTKQLEDANLQIGKLNNRVDSLNTTVANVTNERNKAEKEAQLQADLANECYYAIGSKKELKEHNIIESGFLRKTKIMESDFDKNYFIKADRRTLRTIPLHSKKAKVVTTTQPKGSYEITDQNGQKVLTILNPNEFWSVSNYVVIQID